MSINLSAAAIAAFDAQVKHAYQGSGLLRPTVRMRTGNIAASLGLHAGFVWVITFLRETSVADPANPLHGLLSQFDGVVGWLVFAWTVLVGLALSRFYRLRVSRA